MKNKILKLYIIFLLIISFFNIIYFNKKLNSIFNILNISKKINKIYSILYDLSRENKLKIECNKNDTEKKYKYNKNKGIYVCVQGKNENLYAGEFVEYYKSIGFDKIIILDNNEIVGEKFETVLKDYIENKFVEIINIRDLESIQIPSLNYCYQKYINNFDWILFIDFDEFLYNNNTKKIDKYIYSRRFEKCESILFNTKTYDDNDLEKYDNRPLLKRFTRSINSNRCRIKTMVRGGINNLVIPNVHLSGINIHFFCNSEGKRIFPRNLFGRGCLKNDNFFIKHFSSKSAEEFCMKIKRGDAHFNKMNPKYKFIMERRIINFFSINKITKNKIKIIENCLNISLDKLIKNKAIKRKLNNYI